MSVNQLQVRDLKVIYPNGVKALSDVNLDLETDGICGILGPNGGGKTTFIKGLLGLLDAKGSVRFNGQPIQKLAKQTAYVEQKQAIDMDFPINVFQCVLMGTYPKLGFFKSPGRKEKKKVLNALEKVGLAAYKNYQIGELSGGQFQRVLIARTLVQEADLIFLDEPFVGIDVRSEAIIIEQLKALAQEGKTILIVHHDLSTVKKYFNQVILINKTLIAAGNTAEVYTQENMKKAYEVFDPQLYK